MAPALTEPISPTNKLSDTKSLSGTSPRPIIISNLLITSSSTTPTTSTTITSTLNDNNLLENHNKIKNINIIKTNNNIENKNNNNNNLYSIYRPVSKTFCAFQSAFEESIAKAKIIKTNHLIENQNNNTSTNIKINNINNQNNKIKHKILTKTINTAKLSKESLGINKISILSNGPPDDNLSSEQIVDVVVLSTSATAATSQLQLSTTIDSDNQQMGPMCDTQASANSSTIEEIQQQETTTAQISDTITQSLITDDIFNDKDLQNVQQLTKINNNNNQLLTLDSDIEEAINNTLNNNNKQEQILLKFEEFQHMDLQNCDSSTIVPITTAILSNEQQQCSNNITITNKNQNQELELSQELISTCTSDTTVTAAESANNIFDEHFTESSSQQEQQNQQQITLETTNRRSPPRTPTSSSLQQQQQQQQTTPLSQTLTPQSTGSGSGGAMGLQKDFIKDSNEMDQVLGDMDLLQVLKGFDSTSGGGEAALCDLAGSLGLFNDVDVMSYEEIVTPAPKNLETDEIRNEIERRQQQMQRKCDFLLRRLRKVQSRSMSKHTSEEISGLFEWTNRLIRRKDHDQLPDICYDDDKHRPVTQSAMRSLLKRIDNVATTQHSNNNNNNVTGSALTISLNSTNLSAQKKNKNLLGRNNLLSTTNLTPNDNKKLTIIQKFDNKSTYEIGHIAGLLQTEICQVQCAFDSDVTASSSGGESADEMVTYNNQVQQSLSISKRAAWRWARDRSAIASRWTWLCAQISDLEYRIRQHNELHMQIKKNKGSVTFEKITNLSSGQLECSNNNNLDSSTNVFGANGLRNVINNNNNNKSPGNNNLITTDSATITAPPNGAYDQSISACRTRPFQRIGFRKRRLLQTANVHTISKKAARPSTVKCGCQWPLHPCALCTGRPDPTAPRDLPDTMTESERVALLDPSFHPVLSFPEDVPNSIHIEATLQIPEWQNRIIRNSSKVSSKNSLLSIQKSHNRDERSLTASGSKKFRTQKSSRKQHQQDAMSSPISGNQGISGALSSSANKVKSTKNRKNYDYQTGTSPMTTTQSTSSPQHQNNSLLSGKNSKHRKLLSSSNVAGATLLNSNNHSGGTTSSNLSSSLGNNNMNGFQNAFAESLVNLNCDNLDGAANGSIYPRSKNSSPTPTGRGNGGKDIYNNSSSSYKYERMLERRNRNSYDIDNIVIPYSVAASTRVELLPYKEIPTPKWRLVGDDEYELDEPNNTILSTKLENDDKFLCPKEINNTTSTNDNKINNINKNNEENQTSTTATVELLPPPSPVIIQTPVIENNESDKLNNLTDVACDKKLPSIDTDTKQQHDDDNYSEDISEEAIQNRHERALLDERKKFSTFLKFPWSTRSRANRRIDSRAESSGANTPDPTSPAPNTPSVGGDQESIPSPAAPSTPLNLNENTDGLDTNGQSTPSAITFPSVNNIYNSAGRRGERKRTVSAKKDKDFNKYSGLGDDPRRSSSPDPREIIPPFDPLQFPLTDDLYETMLKMMPNHHQIIDECLKLTSSNLDYNNIIELPNNDIKLMELTNRTNNNIISSNNSSRKNSTSSINNNHGGDSTSIFSISNQDLVSNSFNKNNLKDNNDISIYDNVERQLRLLEDSDTDSAESGIPDEDPNDPEWKEPEK